jgi:hypothetical protein
MQIISEQNIGWDVEWTVLVSFEILPRNFHQATEEK